MKSRFVALALALSALGGTATPSAQRPDADMCVVPPGAQPSLPARILPGMGATDMPVTTASEMARRFFNQGVSQMHSFWFIESERSFLQAAALDPGMAMAWWGISISAAGDYRPAFQLVRDPFDGGREAAAGRPAPEAIQRTSNGAAVAGAIRAREAIAKAMAMRAAVTPRERLYIEAEFARRDPASKTPASDHVAALRALIAAHPDDLEAKSILGLALLDGYDPVTKQPRTNTVEGVTLLQDVVARNDEHFGAHHYLIHGWEGSATPERAWRACQRYPALVTNIPHALHMPGHIYAQSDRIDDAIAAFSIAAENELGWMNADILYPNGHHGHNVHFLVHALNLDGRFADSMSRVQHLLQLEETPRERAGSSQRTAYRQGYYGLVKTLVRFERWSLILDGTTVPVYDRPEQQAWRTWAVGLAHAAGGRMAEARAAHAEMKKHLGKVTASVRPLTAAEIELEATLARRGGDRDKGDALFRKAADMEAALTYTEPPSYPRPVVEGWAVTAASLGDHAAAERGYREALAREPGSGRAYFGIARALHTLGKEADAQAMFAKGRQAWSQADADLPQLRTLTIVPAAQVAAPAGPAAGYRESISGTVVGFDMIPVAAGTVTVGGTSSAVESFLIARTEITWDLYDIYALGQGPAGAGGAVDATSRPSQPYGAPDYGWGHAGYPAISVTRQAAENFCSWLSARTGKPYRLPTEAEWVRAGELAAGQDAAPASRDAITWHRGNSDGTTHPVGTRKPDALGLFDLFGNAAEWVATADGKPATRGGSFRDPLEATGPAARAQQDGSWNARDPQLPKSRWWLSDGPFVGFRVVTSARQAGLAGNQHQRDSERHRRASR